MKGLLEPFLAETEFQIWSYKGCTNQHIASALAAFIKQVSPQTSIVIHRDSDYLEDDQLQSIKESYASSGIRSFFTPGVDIEAIYCNLDHLKAVNPEYAASLDAIYSASQQEAEPELKKHAFQGAMENYSFRAKQKLGNRSEAQLREWSQSLGLDQPRWIKGKVLLPIIRRRFQEEHQENLNVFQMSPFLKSTQMEEALSLSPTAKQPAQHQELGATGIALSDSTSAAVYSDAAQTTPENGESTESTQ